LAATLQNHHGTHVGIQTIRNRLNELGFNGRIARKKPFVSRVNRLKRLRYAKSLESSTLEDWKKVLFTDESSFNVKGSNGKVYVWRTAQEEWNEDCLNPTFSSGRQSVMIWGSMSWSGVGTIEFLDGNMNGTKYLSVLGRNLPIAVEKLGLPSDFKLVHDNAPCHKAKMVTDWIQGKGIQTLPHPPQSPDLNPIEHLWDEVERFLRKNPPSSLSDLKTKLKNGWDQIQAAVTKKLVESMPRRIGMVISNKGRITKY
jgi:hypothetical protein